MRTSLRRRLLVTLLTLTAGIWLITAFSSYRDSRHEIRELFDAQMAQTARTLLSVAGHELIELSGSQLKSAHIHFTGETRFTAGGHEYEHKLAYQLWQQPKNTLLLRSFSAPDTALSKKQNGYSTREINGESWRVFSLLDKNTGFQIQVGEAMAIRDELTDVVAFRLGMPLLIALPLLAVLISLGINHTLNPLKRLADAISRRAPTNLDAVDEENAPEEIAPLLAALNRLFERLTSAFENERRFTADAAHELRTPLAALRVQSQVAIRSTDEGERYQALEKILQGTERASRLIDQLLTLARVDPEAGLKQGERVDLEKLSEEVIAGYAGEAAVKRLELSITAGPDCVVAGQQESLAIMLRNLLDNAIRYTPEGGGIEVALEPREDSVLLRLGDSGPGIPETEHTLIFERFYRLAGQEIAGSGLGLSIVRRIAELHHADLRLGHSRLGGLEVQVQFPKLKARG